MNPKDIEIKKYMYPLPDERIAIHPLEKRDACKLCVCDCKGVKADDLFYNVAKYLPGDAILLYNNTKVINARLRFRKPSGAIIEVFCLEPVNPVDYQLSLSSYRPVEWKCLVGNSKRWHDGELAMDVKLPHGTVVLRAARLVNNGRDSLLRFSWDDSSVSFSEIIGAAGEIPIPPYLNRKTEASDNDDYQTVYSAIEGSVAAPTAGLHFTDELLEKLREQGITTRSVTLHVGAGTFQPVKAENIGNHPMHAELIDVSRELIAELASTTRPVVAVGTTTVRTLESLYHIGCAIAAGEWNGTLDQWYPYSPSHPDMDVKDALNAILDYLDANGKQNLVASTRIIIAPGYKYRIVKQMITNFHQPGSTLLLLVSAAIGDAWKKVYSHALDNGYRFLSYGDACLMTCAND